jgi:hypothetical protein
VLAGPDAGHEDVPVVAGPVPSGVELDDPGGLRVPNPIEEQEVQAVRVL